MQIIATGPVNLAATETLAILLSPLLIALAITLVSAWRGELRTLWMYEKTWGGVRPAAASLEGAEREREGRDAEDREHASAELLPSESKGAVEI